jgi:alpha-tubulin suppressor-like RCC1 family protein
VIFGVGVAALSAGAVIACGSDGASADRGFQEADSAPDAPVLPEAAAASDSAPPRDAGFERGPFDPADEAIVCASATAPCAKELVAGSNHFCARMSDGTVRCWGDDSFGALGAGASPGPKGGGDAGDAGDAGVVDSGSPSATKRVTGLTGATQLSAAHSTTCARVDKGAVLCWGGNEYGQLGLSQKAAFDLDTHDLAKPVALDSAAARVDVGATSACAVLASGDVWCWGNHEQLQLARNGVPSQFVLGPGPASLGSVVLKKTNPGTTTMLGVTASGDVVSWGAVGGKDGVVCGRMSSISPDPLPSAILGLKNVTSLAVTPSLFQGEGNSLVATGIGPVPPPGGGPGRHAHACAVSGGSVSCWGQSDRGALCTGFPDPELEPAAAPIASKAWAQQVAVGDEITCARLTDGTIQCCGDDTKGRLGTGVVGLYSAFFTPASAFKGRAVQVSASNRAVCALVQGGTVECWGSNAHGELGTSEPDDNGHPTPVKVAF